MKTIYNFQNNICETTTIQQKTWIHFCNPTEEERNDLLSKFQIPEAFYNDIEDNNERPRIEIEGDWNLIIIRIPVKNNDDKLPFSTVPLGILFDNNLFITLTFSESELIEDFVNHTKKKKNTISSHFDLVFKLLLSSSVWYLKYLKQINLRIKIAEDNLEKSIKNEELQALLQIEKCLVFFITSIKGNEILFKRIKKLKNHNEIFNEELLEDVEIELLQAEETANIYSSILTGMMDAYASVISNNLNIIMKRLTSTSIILMIPTLIASFYGMNVPNALENNPLGLFIIMICSLLLSIIGVFLFKKKNMF
ncbi:magnesium transporter CorA family protein [Flavobacterium sp.]|uniref:magnesium transporter CorA family protein n=1 Tax=Flavobacterium sp. TaxID=239 RepID=UPI0025BFA0D4|nr:magnesium transporter CorA family protein [Flavobacterium sp.]